MKIISAKKVLLKVFKGFGISLSIIFLLTAILTVGTYGNNSVSLRKETALIAQKGQYVEVDGQKMRLTEKGL